MRVVTRGRVWKAIRVTILALAVGSCDRLFSPQRGCTLIGCTNGLTVHLTSLPDGPFTVEVFTNVGDGVPVFTYRCTTGTGCRQDIVFEDYRPSNPTIRVTTSLGTRDTRIDGGVHYEITHPNGPDCGECWHGTVTALLPVLG
jgi:hypothetical protein